MIWKKFVLLVALLGASQAMPKKHSGIQIGKSIGTQQDPIPDDIVPLDYTIDLTVTELNLQAGNFTGSVTIHLQLKAERQSIPIHGKDLTITKVTIDGSASGEASTPDANDFIQITHEDKSKFPAKIITLKIEYSGILSATDMHGFYQSKYTNSEDKTEYLATTQFEQTYARRAFPCFDEPRFKTPFTVTITHSKGYTALSNTKGTADDSDKQTSKTSFEQTPPMSTYLVAFIVSKLKCNDGDLSDTTTTELCTRFDESKADLAKKTAVAALDAMYGFTNLKYQSLGNKKLTQAGIPDFSPGAMENWGLVTYREAALLSDDESSASDKQKIVTVIAHELSHQWFGDYATLASWDDIFLNEGFATFFEYYAAARLADISDKWELLKQFVVDQLQPALVTDSSGNALPLHYHNNDPEVIESRFDDISYNKGGSILRMVYYMFEDDTKFKKALFDYLNQGLQPLNTNPDNLWSAFSNYLPDNFPDNLTTVMDSWTNQPGYPLLHVALNKTHLSISQESIIKDDNTTWYVPITYVSDKETESQTKTQLWLKEHEIDSQLVIDVTELSNLTWIILNNQQIGYYRVQYDSDLLESIKALLTKNIDAVDDLQRSQLIDDYLNLARLGKIEYNDALDFITFLDKDTSYYSWVAAFNGFNYLLQNSNNEKVLKALKTYITERMSALLKSVKKEPTNQIEILRQNLAYTWACNLGDEDCIKDAKAQFSALTGTDATPVHVDKRSWVYCTALANSDSAKTDYEFLYNIYKNLDSASAKVTILRALGCVNDAEIRETFLETALSEDVRIQDVRYVFESVYTHNGVDDIISFINKKANDFPARFKDQTQLISLITTIGNHITTQKQIDNLNAVSNVEDLDETVKTAITATTTAAKANLDVVKNLEKSLTSFFKIDTNSASINGLSFNLVIVFIAYFFFNFN